MSVLIEANRLGDIIKYEAPNLYSREEIMVGSGQNLTIGTVVAALTADGKMVAFNPTATDGSEVVAGVIAESIDATTAETKSWMIARLAIVSDDGLIWPGGITASQLVTATKQLKQLGILIRKGA